MNEITIDIDEPYDEFVKSRHFELLKCRLSVGWIPFIKKRCIRRSACDRVHLRVVFYIDLTLFDALCIRAFLDDDPVRIACDLARYYRTKKVEDTGRCFSQKYIDGVLAEAGEWERF